MGDVITRWITEKLGLGIPFINEPVSFRAEVANGVLIAEILRKYGLLSDDEFISLSHSHTKDSNLLNMKNIHRWLIKAGMNIEQTLFLDVAEQKSGSAVKLLYELFLYLEDGPRKPQVLEKAKMFLMSGMMTPTDDVEDSTENSLQQRRRPSTRDKKTSLKERQKSSTPGSVQPKERSKLTNKKSNWYTSLDKISVPTCVVKGAPFSQLSEAAQAEALYFSRESLMVLERQRVICKHVENHLQEVDLPHHFQDFKSNVHAEKDLKLVYRLRVQQEEQRNYIEEIRKFDQKLMEIKKNEVEEKGAVKIGENVFCDGKGSPDQMEKRLQALKQRRQKNAQALKNLSKCRKAAAHRLIQNIPAVIHRELDEDVVKQLSKLPFAERAFADFIFNTHLEKANFKQHAAFEAREKQEVNNFDLEKEVRIAQEQNELKKSVLLNRIKQPSKRALDKSSEETERINQHEKMVMVNSMLSDLVTLVVQYSDYRSAMGSASFGTDTFLEAMTTGRGVQAHVILQDERFILEPVHNFYSDILITRPAPLTTDVVSDIDCRFQVHHIGVLLDRFLQIAKGNLVPMKAFTLIIEDLILASKRAKQGEHEESLPSAWLNLSPLEIKRIVYLLMGKRGFINWRNFLIACLDIPYPTQIELIAALNEFRKLDPASLFLVDKNKFDGVTLWFEPKPPCVLSEAFHSLHLKECLFFMFADLNGYFYYIDFLLYFCKDSCPALGIAKSLVVLIGHTFSTRGFEELYNKPNIVIQTDEDLELMFEKNQAKNRKKGGRLAPPNTPLSKLRSESKNKTKETDLDEENEESDEGKKHKKKKSTKVRGKSMKDGKLTFQSLMAGNKIPKESIVSYIESRMAQESKEKIPEKTSMDDLIGNAVPADAFLQTLWFGHITSYLVDDSSFTCAEYLKMKGFVDSVYTELTQKGMTVSKNGIYTAQLQHLLAHPFVSVFIERFSTYKQMDLSEIVKKILFASPSAADFDDLNMESPLSAGSRDSLEDGSMFEIGSQDPSRMSFPNAQNSMVKVATGSAVNIANISASEPQIKNSKTDLSSSLSAPIEVLASTDAPQTTPRGSGPRQTL